MNMAEGERMMDSRSKRVKCFVEASPDAISLPRPAQRLAIDFSTSDLERAITERQLADLFGIAVIAATQNRNRGEDWPPHFRIGKRHIRYRLADVIAWRDARTVGKACRENK
jgi:hypothetical protein